MNPTPDGLSRRKILVAGALGAAGITVVACSSSASSSVSSSPSASKPKPDPQSPTAAATGAAPAGKSIAAVSDVPVGGATLARAQNTTFLVAQPSAGNVVCHSGICTHQQCPLTQIDGEAAVCPCHGSKFDINTGAVINGPATEPLAQISVKVVAGEVVN